MLAELHVNVSTVDTRMSFSSSCFLNGCSGVETMFDRETQYFSIDSSSASYSLITMSMPEKLI